MAVDGTNMPGLYRLDIPDAVLATSHPLRLLPFNPAFGFGLGFSVLKDPRRLGLTGKQVKRWARWAVCRRCLWPSHCERVCSAVCFMPSWLTAASFSHQLHTLRC